MSVFKRYNGSTWEIAGVGITDHTYLTSIGTNTHAQIDDVLAGLSTTYSPIAGPGSSQAFAVGQLSTTNVVAAMSSTGGIGSSYTNTNTGSSAYSYLITTANTVSGGIYAYGLSHATNAGRIFVQSDNAASGGLTLKTNASAPITFEINSIENARISTAGNFLIGTATDNGLAKLQVTNGITLGNTANANATALDWYQEGTFTPVLYGLTSAGTGTYTEQSGRYTRIGNTVTITLSLGWSAHTGTGTMRISGLPFKAASLSPLNVRYTMLTVGSGRTLSCSTNASESTIYMLSQAPTGAGEAAITMDTTGVLYIAGTYFV